MKQIVPTLFVCIVLSLLLNSGNSVAQDSPAKPYFISIDGIDSAMLKEIKPLFGWQAKGRGNSYLQEYYSVWDNDIEVHAIPWTGDINEFDQDIVDVKTQINGHIRLAADRPVVLITHSWGSVLGLIAISQLFENGDIQENDIEVFVSLGSPLESNWESARDKADLYKGRSDSKMDRSGVRYWHNYWIIEDEISGAQSSFADKDKRLSRTDDTFLDLAAHIPFLAHDDYYKDTENWKSIYNDIRNALQFREITIPNVQSSEPSQGLTTIVTSRNPSNLINPAKKYCTGGVCLGDKIEDLRMINWKGLSTKVPSEKVVGLNADEKRKLNNPYAASTDERVSLFRKIEAVCFIGTGGLPTGRFEANNGDEIVVHFGVYPRPSSPRQTYEVTLIERINPSIGPNQASEWGSTVKEKFPEAVANQSWRCSPSQTPCVGYTPGRLYLLAPGIGGSMIKIKGDVSSFDRNVAIDDHPACPRTKISLD